MAYEANGQRKAIKLVERVLATALARRADGRTKKAASMLEHIVAVQAAKEEDGPNRLVPKNMLAVAYRVKSTRSDVHPGRDTAENGHKMAVQ
ncbi:hypothetical protein MAPG_09020 [Magnaporthiopsis poae ATCC 64411]|uniref:Uncharacterized protein n=1 Tax=Magnaporthiopsis poae (strain ATCC 64411 / 73-15) TaxID=644358 RepID=A0A0C4E8V1_MAGP6|nr:hypothetical protein MAPG_09020 [Magnaporthiopsis poae ATCC 64411]